MRKRTRNKRSREKRRNGQGAGASKKNRSQDTMITPRDLRQARKAHSLRSPQARHTDESLKARLAGSLDEWLANQNRLDLPGVDYPGKALYEALEKKPTKKKPTQVNPFRDPKTAKATLQPIIEEYKKKHGIQGEVRVSTVNHGHPARVSQYSTNKSPIVRLNYKHYQDLYDRIDRDIFDKYVEYGISHELAHIQQREHHGFGYTTVGSETDADMRACNAMGTSVEAIREMIDRAEKQLLEASDSPVTELEEKPVGTDPCLTPTKEGRTKAIIKRILTQHPELDIKEFRKLLEIKQSEHANLLEPEALALLVEADLQTITEKPATPEKPSLETLQTLHRKAVPEKPRVLSGSGKQPEAHWLPPTLEEELIKEWHRPEDEKTGVALVKYFTPDGSASWYLSEYMPDDDVFYGWCDMGTGFPELGYVSRKELRGLTGKNGLPIERDYYYQPKTLTDVQGKPEMPPGYGSIAEKKSREKEQTKGVSPSFYDQLEQRKFWAYSGEDGDLYRKHGLGGWRVQIYWGNDLAIQHKITDELGTRWITVADFDNVGEEDRDLVMGYVDEWLSNPAVLKDYKNTPTKTLDDLKNPQTPQQPRKQSKQRSHQAPGMDLIKPKGTKQRKEYHAQTMPYTYLHSQNTLEQIEVRNGVVHVLGMDPSHVSMISMEFPNRLGIPDGVYNGDPQGWRDGNTVLYRSPDKVEWLQKDEGGEIRITKGDKTIEIVLRAGFSETELPEPKIRFTAKATVPLGELKALVDESQASHIYLQTYNEDGRDKLRAWWNEERNGGAATSISHIKVLSDDVSLMDGESTAVYTQSYLEELLEQTKRTGATTGVLQFATDMPLKIEADSQETDTVFWLAPCIDVDDGTKYYPDDPRTTINRGNSSKQRWRDKVIPYTAFLSIATDGDTDLKVKGARVRLRAMDRDHVAMIEVDTQNIMGIEDGEYSGDAVLTERGNKTTYRNPDKLMWDPELMQLYAERKGDQPLVEVRTGDSYLPLPTIQEGTHVASFDIGGLSGAVNEAWKAQRKEINPSVALSQRGDVFVLEYETPEGIPYTETVQMTSSGEKPFTRTMYNPVKLRDFLKLVETMTPETTVLKQNNGKILTVETVNGDSVIRYHLAPMVGG